MSWHRYCLKQLHWKEGSLRRAGLIIKNRFEVSMSGFRSNCEDGNGRLSSCLFLQLAIRAELGFWGCPKNPRGRSMTHGIMEVSEG